MTTPNDPDAAGTSTRPYLIRALHDWCTDNGFTPYLAVFVDKAVQVPREYVKNNEIVSFDATSQLQLGNEFIEFKARFGGVAREIAVPVDHVIAIYARENGQGMAFPVPQASEDDEADGTPEPSVERDRKGGGIRLASTQSAEAADEAGEQEEAVHADAADNGEPEPPAPPPSGPKPSLRRIK
jgi:stringent starvation protein B